jgi:glucose-1-phosphate cytidylyltransferase
MNKADIPVIILAGGYGTRISEETENKPKPMVKIGDKPILWHIINIYAAQGFKKFVIATGYKNEVIDDWVGTLNTSSKWDFNCEVKTLFTGESAQTGGRILKVVQNFNAEKFMLTYGDGVANVNLNTLLDFHLMHRKVATVTSVRPPARFGMIISDKGIVKHFGEKNQADSGWINGGFFVINREIASYITHDEQPFELEPMSKLVADRQLMTIQHHGFWQPMDTLRDQKILENFANSGILPWMNF